MNKCLLILHNRLQSYLEYFNDKGMGTFPFNYEDIKPDLQDDEQIYVNKSYEQWMEKRYQKHVKD